jgi:two-component system, LytTR family, response regulator LytT
MKILLIEDEQPAAKQLTKMLLQLDATIKVIEVLDSIESSVRWLQQYPMPDAIFMDIQIADGLSFEIFNQVTIEAPVIFTTAFDHYAIKAFRVAAVDYLLKPIEPDDLQQAIQRLKEKQQNLPNINSMLQLLQPTPHKDRFLVKSAGSYMSIEVQDIAYFFADEGITQAALFNAKKHIIEYTLDDLEQQLDYKYFFRINRKLLINLRAILKVHPYFNSRLKLDINPPFSEDVFVARERVNGFKTWLGA